MKTPTHSPKGFTLVEMLVTITIIVILAGISISGFKYVTYKQATSQCAIQVKLLENAIEEYKLDNGEYPPGNGSNTLYNKLYWDTDNDGQGVTNPNGTPLDLDQKIYIADLDPLNNRQGWSKGNGSAATIIDPWGNEYIYKNPGTTNPDFDLISMGPDGKSPAFSPPAAVATAKDDIANY